MSELTPIFIMSSERSGTNLLRVLLDNHKDLHAPRAPQLLKTFNKVYPYYKTEEGAVDKQAALHDVSDMINHEYIDWKVDISGAQIKGDSFLDVWEAVYALKAKSQGVSWIVCKENDIFDFAFALKQKMPKAKFIYLYRDVRDVCASWMNITMGFKNVSQAAQNWNQEQLKCINHIETFGLDAVKVSYEELVGDTANTMARLLEALDLPIDTACFDTDADKGRTQDWNEAWKNLSKGVISDNTRKYVKQLSTEDINLIETRAKEAMKLLGYSLDTKADWKPQEQGLINRLGAQLVHRTTKPAYNNKSSDDKEPELHKFTAIIKRIRQRRMG